MEKPTLSLGADEWRALVLTNLAQAHQFVSANQITADNIAALNEHLDRTKLIIGALAKATRATGTGVTPDAAAPPVKAATANGAAKPERKGGWPKGKPRKARAKTQVEAVQ